MQMLMPLIEDVWQQKTGKPRLNSYGTQNMDKSFHNASYSQSFGPLENIQICNLLYVWHFNTKGM